MLGLFDGPCVCFDVHSAGDSALLVSCGLERLSDGSCWRGYLYLFNHDPGPPAPVGSRPAAHTWPCHGRRPGQPMRAGQSH